MKTVPFYSLLAPAGLVGLTILTGAFLPLPNANADDAVDQVNITIPESCSVEGVIASGGEHTKTVQNNQYYSEIGTTTFKTYCNDNNGYAIYAVGYSNDEIGNTLMKHNVSSTYDFDTGVADSGNTSNWAMKLAPISGTYAPTIHSDTNGAFTSYHIVPSEYTKVASFASNTDLPATGINATGSGFTSTYASFISATQVAGTYTGKVKYTLVHPASEVPAQPQTANSNCINYFANASNAVGTMGCQSVSASATSATLLASNFSREGYGFAGWSDAYDYVTNPNAHFYGPQEDITFTAGQYRSPNPGLALYAVWAKSAGSLQDAAKVAELCNATTGTLVGATYVQDSGDPAIWSINANLSSVSALTDARDNQTYAIAKLADGNCWMVENLRLNNTAELTIANTNNPLNDGTNVTLKHNYTDTNTYNTLSPNSSVAYDVDTAPEGWCTTNSATCSNQSRLRTDNTTNRRTNPTNNSGSMYSYGNYYNWYSATAGRGIYNSGNNIVVAGDLCPIGWHLPYGNNSTSVKGGNTTGGFYYLANSMTATSGVIGSRKLRVFPNNFVYSSFVNGSGISNRGSYAYYWSSTTTSDNGHAYGLYFDNGLVFPGTNGVYTQRGEAVRCVVSLDA